MNVALVLLCVIGAAVAGDNDGKCWSSGNGVGARYWDEGTRIDRGRFWYECRNGELKPMGCFTDNKERLYIYGTTIKGGYELTCVVGDDDYLRFDYTACVPDGVSRYQPGHTWEDSRSKFYYECRKEGDFLRAEIIGCISHDKTQRLKLGEKFDDGQFVYECRIKSTGAAQMCSVGCVYNGRRYAVGEQWDEGDYVYYCKSENGRCSKQCVGCQFENRRLYDGDRYSKGKTVYQCEIRPGDQRHKPVACKVKDTSGYETQRVIGCRWYDQKGDSKVEMTCKKNGDLETEVETVGCIYVKNGFDTLFIEPGTYTIYTDTMDKPAQAIACKDLGNGEFEVEKFAVDQIASRAFGLRYTSPKG